MALAEGFGIKDYPCPAGGCLLTDPGFANRMRDLLRHDELTIENAKLIKVGRHFRLSEKVRLIIGRDENENAVLETFFKDGDLILQVRDVPSPFAILRGEGAAHLLKDACAIVAAHTKARERPLCNVSFRAFPCTEREDLSVAPAPCDRIDNLRI
jgi:hypothetical protein